MVFLLLSVLIALTNLAELKIIKKNQFEFNTDSTQIRSGTLVEIEHDVIGTVVVTIDSNQIVIRFSTDFETDEGPDLFVMLATKSDEHIETDQLVSKLEKFEGKQSYSIKNSKIHSFNFIQIWCKQYDVVFSSAKLSKLKE